MIHPSLCWEIWRESLPCEVLTNDSESSVAFERERQGKKKLTDQTPVWNKGGCLLMWELRSIGVPQPLPVWWEPGVCGSLEPSVSRACLLPHSLSTRGHSRQTFGREQGGHSELENAKVKPPVALKKLSLILIDHGHLVIVIVATLGCCPISYLGIFSSLLLSRM